MKILFVCTGNICRSPTAEAVLRHQLAAQGLSHITVDSAGTHGYHIGEAPDKRSIAAAKKRGFELEHLRGRKVAPHDFHEFDLILACDEDHLEILKRARPDICKAKVELFLEYAGATKEREVPDPYYGDAKGFEQVLDLVEAAGKKLIEKLK